MEKKRRMDRNRPPVVGFCYIYEINPDVEADKHTLDILHTFHPTASWISTADRAVVAYDVNTSKIWEWYGRNYMNNETLYVCIGSPHTIAFRECIPPRIDKDQTDGDTEQKWPAAMDFDIDADCDKVPSEIEIYSEKSNCIEVCLSVIFHVYVNGLDKFNTDRFPCGTFSSELKDFDAIKHLIETHRMVERASYLPQTKAILISVASRSTAPVILLITSQRIEVCPPFCFSIVCGFMVPALYREDYSTLLEELQHYYNEWTSDGKKGQPFLPQLM
jgi:hypothetical protein